MVMVENSPLRYYKSTPSWSKTIYVIGLPRSGKSTVFNILGSCLNVEGIEEPFDLLVLAQKGSCYARDSEIYESYLDSYMAIMEHLFSELFMGRIYNFRIKDKSCIYNIKSEEHVKSAHEIARRCDLMSAIQNIHSTFLVVMNDVERSIEMLISRVPDPTIVYLKRDFYDVAVEIADKAWLTNEQLSIQANLTPAYCNIAKLGKAIIYVPFIIDNRDIELFISQDNFNRALMYAYVQDCNLKSALKKYRNLVIEVQLEDLLASPRKVAYDLLDCLDLKKTMMTDSNIQGLCKMLDVKSSYKVSREVNDFIANYHYRDCRE